MARRTRLWDKDRDDDPLAGLINLFDLWIVVVVGLVLALLQSTARERASQNVGETSREPVPDVQLVDLPRYRESDSSLTGRGTKLGIAYRLENGEIVYAPEQER